jgi:hypothetical protein
VAISAVFYLRVILKKMRVPQGFVLIMSLFAVVISAIVNEVGPKIVFEFNNNNNNNNNNNQWNYSPDERKPPFLRCHSLSLCE